MCQSLVFCIGKKITITVYISAEPLISVIYLTLSVFTDTSSLTIYRPFKDIMNYITLWNDSFDQESTQFNSKYTYVIASLLRNRLQWDMRHISYVVSHAWASMHTHEHETLTKHVGTFLLSKSLFSYLTFHRLRFGPSII